MARGTTRSDYRLERVMKLSHLFEYKLFFLRDSFDYSGIK